MMRTKTIRKEERLNICFMWSSYQIQSIKACYHIELTFFLLFEMSKAGIGLS